jgi:hypothetical protein
VGRHTLFCHQLIMARGPRHRTINGTGGRRKPALAAKLELTVSRFARLLPTRASNWVAKRLPNPMFFLALSCE